MAKYYYIPSIHVEANIKVSSLEQMGWKSYLGVHLDTRLAFYANGFHHDGVVIKCSKKIIAPGSSARVTFAMNSDALLDTNTSVGDSVELRFGPVIIAIAEILSIPRVWAKVNLWQTTISPEEERRYLVLNKDGGLFLMYDEAGKDT